jgi:hypothetical protein
MVPGAQPFVEIRNGRLRHPPLEGSKPKKLVFVSNCGFWEMENFDPVISQMKAFCETASVEFSGALLRPHGPMLKGMLAKGAPVSDILEAAKEAGRQMATAGRMSDETLRAVSRPLLPRDAFIQLSNKFAREALQK